jgi:exopolysaccharide production protein ExoQ
MAPSLAASLYCAGIAGLFLLDRQKTLRTSPALWLPIIWLGLGSSRGVSQWLDLAPANDSPDQYLEGNPIDRSVMLVLLLAGILVLVKRRREVSALVRANGPVLLFLSYAALSFAWSDFPWTSFKRWSKVVGNVAMVWIVLTDPTPRVALERFFARPAFVLIPLSVLFIKYFPDLGRSYDRWVGTPFYNGVAIGKNSLGVICLVFGLASAWRFIEALHTKPRRTATLVAHGTILAMVGWLLHMADSATSMACFAVGTCMLIALRKKSVATVYAAIASVIVLGLVFFLLSDGYGLVVGALGRNVTLTGRTFLWDDVLRMTNHPLIGAGFEAFWLGPRAEYLWKKYWWHPNQAHNGYLECYLNLGWIGIGVLAILLLSGYRNAVGLYRQQHETASLVLAMLAVSLLYNCTEAAFKVMNPLWISVLLTATVVPPPAGALADARHGTDLRGVRWLVNWGARRTRKPATKRDTGEAAVTRYGWRDSGEEALGAGDG